MESYLRLGIVMIGAVIVFFILFEAWLRRRRMKAAENFFSLQTEKTEPNLGQMEEPLTPQAIFPEGIITISVFAKDKKFESYDLLQTIAATGMELGEMNIFHYYFMQGSTRRTLFSLASATKPGSFNLDRMGDFSCVGLTLFMDLHAASNLELALQKMLVIAEQLADDLDGELRLNPSTRWTDEHTHICHQLIQQYQVVEVAV